MAGLAVWIPPDRLTLLHPFSIFRKHIHSMCLLLGFLPFGRLKAEIFRAAFRKPRGVSYFVVWRENSFRNYSWCR